MENVDVLHLEIAYSSKQSSLILQRDPQTNNHCKTRNGFKKLLEESSGITDFCPEPFSLKSKTHHWRFGRKDCAWPQSIHGGTIH